MHHNLESTGFPAIAQAPGYEGAVPVQLLDVKMRGLLLS